MKQQSVRKNAVLNVIKQCCTVLFPLIIYPYISRTLGSASFGRFSFASSIIEFCLVFAALGIPTYIVREASRIRENREQTNKITAQVFTISLISMAITLISLGLLVAFVPKLSAEWKLYCILSINIIFFVLGRDWINTVFEDYFFITVRYIVFKTISLFLIILLVNNESDVLKYAAITVFADSGAYLINLFYTRRYSPYRITKDLDLGTHLKPILYLFCTTLAVRIYIQSDITILGIFRTDSEVGVYSLASKIYSVIKSIINAVIFVAIPRIAFYLGSNEVTSYNNILFKLKEVLLILAFPCVTGSIVLSKNIMEIMGGSEYVQGYISFIILSLSLIFAVFACYYSQAIMVPNREEKKYFYFTSISAILNVVLNIILVPYFSINGAAVTTLISEVVICFCCYKLASKYFENQKSKNIVAVIIGCCLIVMICLLFDRFILNTIIATFASMIVSVICYYFVLLLFKNEFALSIHNRITTKLGL